MSTHSNPIDQKIKSKEPPFLVVHNRAPLKARGGEEFPGTAVNSNIIDSLRGRLAVDTVFFVMQHSCTTRTPSGASSLFSTSALPASLCGQRRSSRFIIITYPNTNDDTGLWRHFRAPSYPYVPSCPVHLTKVLNEETKSDASTMGIQLEIVPFVVIQHLN